MFNKIKINIGFLLIVGLITSGCISVKEQKASILPKANISLMKILLVQINFYLPLVP